MKNGIIGLRLDILHHPKDLVPLELWEFGMSSSCNIFSINSSGSIEGSGFGAWGSGFGGLGCGHWVASAWSLLEKSFGRSWGFLVWHFGD